ncbi:DUF547 domain-containing protein [Desulfospira joergensenii]|uniref:DUF547 domain-containing protein n=1 Tax=Desulfospira joergensenii TaxID=53329 RepID=UPI00042023D5|nr:DUF547 domain-containing protein [Desulfospira joergensenii]
MGNPISFYKKAGASVLFFMVLFLAFPGPCPAGVDNRIYAGLLKKHVFRGRVDYDGFKQDEKRLDEYLELLSRTDLESLSRSGRFAFYINLYNAATIQLVLTEYPGINSIKEIGSFFSGPWSRKFISLNGRKLSLDQVEHDILRPFFKDPRVHFAVNCASKSCPALLNVPYEGKTLETQLDDQATAFINDPRRNTLRGTTLFASRIFDWFREDFNDNPLGFIRQYARGELKENLDGGKEIKLDFLPYDWSLNR